MEIIAKYTTKAVSLIFRYRLFGYKKKLKIPRKISRQDRYKSNSEKKFSRYLIL